MTWDIFDPSHYGSTRLADSEAETRDPSRAAFDNASKQAIGAINPIVQPQR